MKQTKKYRLKIICVSTLMTVVPYIHTTIHTYNHTYIQTTEINQCTKTNQLHSSLMQETTTVSSLTLHIHYNNIASTLYAMMLV